MDLIGKKVKHKHFGEGVITRQDASCISVKFVSEVNPTDNSVVVKEVEQWPN